MKIPKLEICMAYREGSTVALRATAPPAADAKVEPMRRAAAPPAAKNNL